MEPNLDQQKRKNVTPPTSGIGAPPANFVAQPASSVPTPPTSGIAAKPGTIMINGVPHQNLADQKFPGPLGMMANAAGETIKFAATAPFSSRAEERLAANRAELNPLVAGAPMMGAEESAIRAKNTAVMNGQQSAADPAALAALKSAPKLITAESAQSAMANPMARSGGISGSMDGAGVNAIMARENAARQSMIDSQRTDGANVAVLGGDTTAADNAEKTARWGRESMIGSLKGKGRAANAMAQVMASGIAGQNNMATEQMRQQSEAGRNAVTMRGQDIATMKADGTPADQQLKQAQAQGIMAQTDSSRMLADIQKKALTGDAQALATYQALTGKTKAASDRFVTVQGGEEIGPDGMTKIKRPGGVFDAQTQKFVPMDVGQSAQKNQAPSTALDYLKKNPSQASAFRAKYGYLPEGF